MKTVRDFSTDLDLIEQALIALRGFVLAAGEPPHLVAWVSGAFEALRRIKHPEKQGADEAPGCRSCGYATRYHASVGLVSFYECRACGIPWQVPWQGASRQGDPQVEVPLKNREKDLDLLEALATAVTGTEILEKAEAMAADALDPRHGAPSPRDEGAAAALKGLVVWVKSILAARRRTFRGLTPSLPSGTIGLPGSTRGRPRPTTPA